MTSFFDVAMRGTVFADSLTVIGAPIGHSQPAMPVYSASVSTMYGCTEILAVGVASVAVNETHTKPTA
jgi:hypothetical protein